jgi:hypothetical protein
VTSNTTPVRYFTAVPKKVPAGCIVCHNVNWIPGRRAGEDGFRFYTLPADAPGAAKECHCGWASNLSKHYTTVGKPHTRAQHKAWLRKLMKTKEWQKRYGRRPHVVRAVESFLSSS